MSEDKQKEGKCLYSNPVMKYSNNNPKHKQEIFSISSSINYPIKKPCQFNCSHHPHHLRSKHQEEIWSQQPFNISEISRKSEICSTEHNCVLPSCLQHLNELHLKQTVNNKNDNALVQSQCKLLTLQKACVKY